MTHNRQPTIVLLLITCLISTLLLGACGEDAKISQSASPTTIVTNIAPTPTPQVIEAQQLRPAFLRWSYYIPGDKASLESLKTNLAALDYISPMYFFVEADGRVSGQDETNTTALIKSQGVKIVPMIQNKPQGEDFAKILSDPQAIERILTKLDEITTLYGYDGIHIDFEGLNEASRDSLTDFMRRLYARFNPKNKLVTMAVAAKQGDIGNRSAFPYDYDKLAPYVDLVNVMTYDYSYMGGKAGPIAPLDWVTSVARYASSRFGGRKVLLGIPYYGYEWNVTINKFVTSRRIQQVIDLVSANKGNFFFNEDFKSPYAEYIDTNGDTRRVWYEDERSWAAKLALVDKLKLAGYAGWRLGQEIPGFWDEAAKLTPSTARKAPSNGGAGYFRTTGQTVSPLFKTVWDKNGGLERFGQPLTGELDETINDKPRKVQYFEKARFEYYPELKGTPNEVQIGTLGRMLCQGREKEKYFQPVTAPLSSPTVRFFKETGHSLVLGFKSFWEEKGGLSLYGFPISEEFNEISQFDGKSYTVQYFERARLEYDPSNGLIRQGYLGTQYLWQTRGWLR